MSLSRDRPRVEQRDEAIPLGGEGSKFLDEFRAVWRASAGTACAAGLQGARLRSRNGRHVAPTFYSLRKRMNSAFVRGLKM